MHIAYLIITHESERPLQWLLNAIYCPQDSFLVHVDKKTPDCIYNRIVSVAEKRENVRYMPRRLVTWGAWSLFAQTGLDAIKTLLKWNRQWQYFVNLSGQDYPIKSVDYIHDILSTNKPMNYLRVEHVRTLRPRLRGHIWRRTHSFAFEHKGRLIRLPSPRRHPKGFKVEWYGSAWHILSRDFCEWVVSDPSVERCISFFRHMYCPEEHFMQTLIMNSPFRDSVVNGDEREIIWTGEPHPKILTSDDYSLLINSDALFARKFDEEIDQDILYMLANKIGVDPPVS